MPQSKKACGLISYEATINYKCSSWWEWWKQRLQENPCWQSCAISLPGKFIEECRMCTAQTRNEKIISFVRKVNSYNMLMQKSYVEWENIKLNSTLVTKLYFFHLTVFSLSVLKNLYFIEQCIAKKQLRHSCMFKLPSDLHCAGTSEQVFVNSALQQKDQSSAQKNMPHYCTG